MKVELEESTFTTAYCVPFVRHSLKGSYVEASVKSSFIKKQYLAVLEDMYLISGATPILY